MYKHKGLPAHAVGLPLIILRLPSWLTTVNHFTNRATLLRTPPAALSHPPGKKSSTPFR